LVCITSLELTHDINGVGPCQAVGDAFAANHSECINCPVSPRQRNSETTYILSVPIPNTLSQIKKTSINLLHLLILHCLPIHHTMYICLSQKQIMVPSLILSILRHPLQPSREVFVPIFCNLFLYPHLLLFDSLLLVFVCVYIG
jgi:hypothetical protein